MAAAGVDGIVCHLGVGGEMPSLEETPAIVTRLAAAAHAVNEEVLVLTHGGHISTPQDAAWVAERSPSVGYLGAPDSPALLGRVNKQRTQEYKHRLP